MNMDNFKDEYGYIGHRDESGNLEHGDCLQRLGMYYVGLHLSMISSAIKSIADRIGIELHNNVRSHEYNALTNRLILPSGEWIRHCDRSKWPGQSGTVTWDQLIPNIVALGFFGFKYKLRRLLFSLAKRGFFVWNSRPIGSVNDEKIPDPINPIAMSCFIRSFKNKWLYPLLLFFDLFILGNSIIRVIKSGMDPDDVGDDVNHIIVLLQARLIMPTPVSFFARRFYIAYRANAGKDKDSRLDGLAPQTALDHYFRKQTGAPPMNELYSRVLWVYLRD